MTGLVIGGIVVILALATAIKAVCVVGPLLDENTALRSANKDLVAAHENEMRGLRMKVHYSELCRDRMKEIAEAAWKHGDRLYARLEKYEPCEDKPSDDPDYFDHLDSLEAEREAEGSARCTCNEAYEAMHDLENTCELHN